MVTKYQFASNALYPLRSTPWLLKWPIPIRFSEYNSAHSCHILVRSIRPVHLNILYLMAAVSLLKVIMTNTGIIPP